MTAPLSVAPQPPLVLADIVTCVARHRRAVALTTLVVGLGAATILLVVPPRYTGRTSFVPESHTNQAVGGLAGIAALAGVTLPGGAAGQSPEFYAALLQSRPILYGVLQRYYPTTDMPGPLRQQDSATLVTILKPRGATDAQRLWEAARKLSAMIAVRADMRTGIITLTFEHRSPVLAALVARAFTEELEHFNRETRQTRAGARRRFVESRLLETGHELEAAENDLRAFMMRNREWQNSPTLRFEHSRLERALAVQQELYLNLRRELDAARIAEVDDIPQITITEPVVVPQRRSSPARRLWFAASVVAAFFGAIAAAVFRDYHSRLAPGVVPALRGLMPGRLGR